METLHNLKYKGTPDDRLSNLKGFRRSKLLSLATPEKIISKGVTDHQGIIIRRG